jgi:hypothetical protein
MRSPARSTTDPNEVEAVMEFAVRADAEAYREYMDRRETPEALARLVSKSTRRCGSGSSSGRSCTKALPSPREARFATATVPAKLGFGAPPEKPPSDVSRTFVLVAVVAKLARVTRVGAGERKRYVCGRAFARGCDRG